jgi:uncharacterized membrane protein
MATSATSAYLRAAGIGAVSGLRTFTAPAATLGARDNLWTGLVTALAAGEILADKLPMAPSRLLPPALAARIVAGGACGSVVAGRFEGSRAVGAVLGALCAIASAYAGYGLRMALTHGKWLPNVPAGLVEDGIAVWGARTAVAE